MCVCSCVCVCVCVCMCESVCVGYREGLSTGDSQDALQVTKASDLGWSVWFQGGG